MRFFAAVNALPSLESMKFPVFSLLAGNFGLFRDEFAADSPLQRRVERTPVRDYGSRTNRNPVMQYRIEPCRVFVGAIAGELHVQVHLCDAGGDNLRKSDSL